MSQITITQSDIEAVWGSTYVAQWSNTGSVSQSPTVNVSRVTVAINFGKARVNGLVANGPYTVPLDAIDDAAVPTEITDAMATEAGYWLFKTSGINYTKETLTWVQDNVRRVETTLASIRIGNYPVACNFNTGRRQAPRVSCWR